MIKYRESILNQKFGKLTVIRFSHTDKWKKTHWECKCECGNTTIARKESLTRGHTTTCGNRNIHFTTINSRNWKGHGDIGLSYYSDLKREGERRGYTFQVSISYLWDLFLEQNKKCTLSGLPLVFGKTKLDNEANASVDRIDSTKGYVEGNVQWVDKRINFMKGSLPQQEFIQLCKLISQTS